MWEVKTSEPDAVPQDWVDQTLRQRVVGCILTSLSAIEPGAVEAAREAVECRMPAGPGWLAELFGPPNGRIPRREDVLSKFPA